MPRTTSTSSRTAAPAEGALRFSLLNWVLLASGLVAIVIGFVALARGSTAAAPLLLMLGYLVLIPLGIIR
ncbi:MAG: hypothetical protein H0X65_00690 [Gemmatimonadetes bacterium]|jgi:uncharacterized membrane protein HdeD (DUF308 family)|nr:hypothetical protein [Gemmatimonadota bacterium]